MPAETYRIEVFADISQNIHDVVDVGYTQASAKYVEVRLYFLNGDFTPQQLDQIATTLLADPVTEQYTILPTTTTHNYAPPPDHYIDIAFLPGVTDPVAENLSRRIQQLGYGSVQWTATGKRYLLYGALHEPQLHDLAGRIFSNPVIQGYRINAPIIPSPAGDAGASDQVEIVPIVGADDATLITISQQRRLALNLSEMQAVRLYYESEGRNPTDLELEMIAQTWSEHCVHKTFRAPIHYRGPDGEHTINGLLKTYIRAATEKLNKPWLRSVFVDNAGIIAFDEHHDLAFKVETHNHPSAIEPFGGANTGVGGVIRDVLGVSARPIANTDVLCFGPPDAEQLPEGVLHPVQIAAGVVHGIEDYGNKMGIPTVNGAVLYDDGYTANPLVFCGCLGILPHGSHPTTPQVGDYIIVLGGRTGRDGLRGATFSSMEMDAQTGTVAGSSVQIGHPINEKQVQEVILRARDEKLYHAITDCGAGGLSSAVGEMTEGIGGYVQLKEVPLKYDGLQPWEIWLSEAQERMVMAVPPENWPRLQEICEGQDVEAVKIGHFEASGRLRIDYGERTVGDISLEFLHDGLPLCPLEAVYEPPQIEETAPADIDPHDALLKLLAHPNIRNKEDIVRRYDHEVQGGIAVKPFGGVAHSGHNDGAVIVPQVVQNEETPAGVVLSAGICPQYPDPYAMAWAAVDEAVRNAVAVGADPERIALLDNFCWGNPNLPDRLGSLVRCAEGCYDAALAYGAPFISGKDSLNNEYADSEGQRHAIPGTLLISAVSIVPDVTRTTTSDLKQAGDYLYAIGLTREELGGSHYGLVTGAQYATSPQPNPDALMTLKALHAAIRDGLVRACHDCSEGGWAVTLAEMCIGGGLGAEFDLCAIPAEGGLSDTARAFAESLTRFVVEVHPEDAPRFEAQMQGVPFARVGQVTQTPALKLRLGLGDIEFPLAQLADAWGVADRLPQTPVRPTAKPQPAPAVKKAPRVLILHANGTNRDHDAAIACRLAGGEPEIVHINQLRKGERRFSDYHMLVVPGGFSYGDDLGAGRLWALDLRHDFADDMAAFVAAGKPVIGICNGFQTLVKSGLLPGDDLSGKVTLTYNQSRRFECRWVYLAPNPNSPSLFTKGLEDMLIACPVAHGEGRLMVADEATREALWQRNLPSLTYVNPDGSPAAYPANPNGSVDGIAALSNQAGNVFGLMPHPENHIFPWQHPRHHRGEAGNMGLVLFTNGVRQA
ncbi:MAG: phosphoribosylformylglycinamidine synthase subunit PurL [Chloroflexi bacterium]|nr:MAG: phosphoribosylformylglycinamidine synthase subunit PurL [Chloroflexota bacterium]